MTTAPLLFFGVLVAMMAFFVWGRWRYDLVALGALLTLVLLTIVPVERAFLGFAHPAVITVAAVLVVSRALLNAGVVDLLGKALSRAGDTPTRHVGALSGATALVSGFINNIGALAVLLPLALRTARKAKRSPSFLLIPLAFASLLGGLVTLIGTPPNIIIATFRGDAVGTPFAFFDFTPVGAAVAVAGLLFMVLVGWRLVPRRKGQASREELFQIDKYLTELRVTDGSKVAGQSLREVQALAEEGIQVVGLVRGDRRLPAPSPFHVLRPEDVLIVEGSSEDIQALMGDTGLELGGEEVDAEALGSDEVELAEAVVLPRSRIVGKTARGLNLRLRYGINVLAVARQGARVGGRLGDIRFQTGDVLLVQGPADRLHESLSTLGCLPLAERDLALGRPRNALLALGIFGAGVATISLGLVRVDVGFVLVAVAMVLAGFLSPREVYERIDWPIIILLGALIPVGEALETTGGAALLADSLLGLGAQLPTWVILTLLLVAAMLLSDVINNAATAVLLAPVAIGVAAGLGASVDPFLMAVAVGASCAFLTPIGHQSNTLVWGPGGYRFGDYWRVGLPLEVVIVVVAVPLILLVWPL